MAAISMGTAALIGGTALAGSALTSRATRKAANKQAQGIENAQNISKAAAEKARRDVLGLYGPAFQDIYDGINNNRNDLMQGRQSFTDILNQSAGNTSNILQTTAQRSMNALMGNQSQPDQFRMSGQDFGGMFGDLSRQAGGTSNLRGMGDIQSNQGQALNNRSDSVLNGFVSNDIAQPEQSVNKGPDPMAPGNNDMSRPLDPADYNQTPQAMSQDPATSQLRPQAMSKGVAPNIVKNNQAFDPADRQGPSVADGGIRAQPSFDGINPFAAGGGGGIANSQLLNTEFRTGDPTQGPAGGPQSIGTGGTPVGPVNNPYGFDLSSLGTLIDGNFDYSRLSNLGQQAATDRANDPIYRPMQEFTQQPGEVNVNQMQMQVQAPDGQYGLGATEQALQNAIADQTSLLRGSTQGAMQTVGGGFDEASRNIQQGMQGQVSALGAGMDMANSNIMQGMQGQVGALGAGINTARNDIRGGLQSGLQALMAGMSQGRNDLSGALSGGLGDLNSARSTGRNDITGQLNQGLGALRQGVDTARGDIDTYYDQATGRFEPINQFGTAALEREAALTGAMGQDAQQAAFDQYMESPGQKFFRERQEQALMRNASATGGLGGGRVLEELQRQAMGNASQNYQQDLSNLRNLAQRGEAAYGSMAQLDASRGGQLANLAAMQGQTELGARQTAGGQLSSLEASIGGSKANLRSNIGNSMANLASQGGAAAMGAYQNAGSNLANIATTGSQNIGNAIGTGYNNMANVAVRGSENIGNTIGTGYNNLANSAVTRGNTLGGMQQELGNNLATLSGNYGNQIAGLRMGVGQDIANSISGVGNNLGNLQQNLGGAMANNENQFYGALGGLSNQYGQNSSGLRTGLAATLGNIATGQGSQQAQLAQNLGAANAAGQNNMLGNALGTFAGFAPYLSGGGGWGAAGGGGAGTNAVSNSQFVNNNQGLRW